MKIFKQLITSLFLFVFCQLVYGAENTFYVLHYTPQDITSLNQILSTIKQNHQSIQMLISQAYQVDETGNVTGYVNDELVDLAKTDSIKFMAMITNASFDQSKVHLFLSSETAQDKAIHSILAFCKKYQFYGVQFDFENICVDEKQHLTQFYNNAAKILHQAGYKVSYAVIPAFAKDLNESIFLRKTYQNWSGVYDLKALGESGDFITLMAYNQHTDATIPGPNAGISYVEAAIQNALQAIPANKLSLGIPTYSLHWYSGRKTLTSQQTEISFKEASELIKKYQPQIFWNEKEKVYQIVYERNWLDEYIYLEDARSFAAKIALAKTFNLRGISVFCIGTEDSRIWSLLANKP